MNTINPIHPQEYSKDYVTIKNQVSVLYSQSTITYIFPVIAALALTFVLWEVANRVVLIAWLTMVFMHSVFRYYLLWKYNQCTLTHDNVGNWLNKFIVSVFFSGLLWGITGIVLIPYDNTIEFTLYNGLTLLVVCGLVAGALISYSINLWVLVVYSLPALVPPALYLISLGDQFNSVFGGFILLYYFFVSVAAFRMNGQFKYFLEMDAQQKELVYKYEKLKAVYSEFRKRVKR